SSRSRHIIVASLPNTVNVRVIAPPLDRVLKLFHSVTNRVPMPDDTLPDSRRQDLPHATLCGVDISSSSWGVIALWTLVQGRCDNLHDYCRSETVKEVVNY
ncbi:unnamed protein product, partial [Hapterophycus canaliculatus]